MAEDLGWLLGSLKKAKGVAVWAGPDGERIRFGADAPCADDDAAAQVAATAEATWKTTKADLSEVRLLLVLFRPKLAQALRELIDSPKFAPDGKTARLTGEVSRKSLADASDEFRQAGAPNLGLSGLSPKSGAGGSKKR